MVESFTPNTDVLGGGNRNRKQKVSYYYDEDFSVFQVSDSHPIKPLRIKMTDTLIREYGMDKHMENLKVDEEYVSEVDFTLFHSDDYVDCLRQVTPEHKEKYHDHFTRFCFSESDGDCPVFDYMFDYCQRYTAGTLVASD